MLDMEAAHQGTIFTLGGAHEQLDCISCHRNGFTQGFHMQLTRCEDCHQSNFEQATNPDHVASGFPKQCEMCHNLMSWQPAYFKEHEAYFPIYSGAHQGTWSSCTTCHQQANNYTLFTCFTCHEHNQSTTDAKHREVSGYVYSSQACYQCHPTGQGEGNGD